MLHTALNPKTSLLHGRPFSETPNAHLVSQNAHFKNKGIASREHLKYNKFNGKVATLATRTYKKRRLFYELESGGRFY